MQFDIHRHHPPTPRANNTTVRVLNASDDVPVDSYFTVGIHPWNTAENDEESAILHKLHHPNCIGIGEIGFDKLKGPDLEIQKKSFEIQLKLAIQFSLPVVLHLVKAEELIIPYLRETGRKIPFVVHGFRGKKDQADRYLKYGAYLSFGAALLHSEATQACFERMPIDRIFLETDDEPSVLISSIYEKAASIKKIEVTLLEEAIQTNFATCFKRTNDGTILDDAHRAVDW